MEVLVRKPPVFTIEPDSLYQRKVGETVEMHCDAQETEGTQKPTIQWQRVSKSCGPLTRFIYFLLMYLSLIFFLVWIWICNGNWYIRSFTIDMQTQI
jgi:hypothetical protein